MLAHYSGCIWSRYNTESSLDIFFSWMLEVKRVRGEERVCLTVCWPKLTRNAEGKLGCFVPLTLLEWWSGNYHDLWWIFILTIFKDFSVIDHSTILKCWSILISHSEHLVTNEVHKRCFFENISMHWLITKYFWYHKIFKRPGVAGAVLQTALWFSN